MINRYSKAINNTKEEYVGLPLDMMMEAAKAIQERGDRAEQERDATKLGLASIVAKAPGHRQVVDKFVQDFNTESAAALDKVGMNTSNPEFKREIARIKLKYAADPRLQVIKDANEKITMNDQMAAQLKAKGQLFTRPKFTGVDTNGNVTSEVPGVEAVNTLDDWNKQFSIAHQSMQNDGRGHETNRGNLNRTRQIIEYDIKAGGPNSSKLTQAYIEQGMTPDQAKNAVKTQLEGMVNSYGIVDKRDWSYDQLQLQQRNSEENSKYRRAMLEKAANKNKKAEPFVLTPTFSPYTTVKTGASTSVPMGAVSTTKNGLAVYGSGESMNGTRKEAVKNQNITGKLYVVNNDDKSALYTPKNQTKEIKQGMLVGYKNVYVNKTTGELVATYGKSKGVKMDHDANGNLIGYKNGKPFSIEERTVAEYSNENETVFRVATKDEALREMGVGNAAYEGRYTNSSVDFDFVKKYYAPEDIAHIGASISRIQQGKGTPEDYANLKGIQQAKDEVYYNKPGGIRDSFKEQGKRTNITGKPGSYTGPNEWEYDKLTEDELNLIPGATE